MTARSTTHDRSSQLAARLAAHHLDTPVQDLAACTVLRTGLQDTGPGTADAALALRVEGGSDSVRAGAEAGELVTVLSLRGAPHLHRRADVRSLQAALVPESMDDLEATTGPLPEAVRVRGDAVADLAQAVAEAMGDHESWSKSGLSTATTPLLDDELSPWCTPCGVHHAIDGLFRLATLRAGLHLVPGGRTQTFARLDGVPPLGGFTVTSRTAASARRALLGQAAASAAPADVEQLAAWLGWHPSTVRATLEKATLEKATPPTASAGERGRTARLLPARDPWLRGSDRAWLMGGNLDRRGEVFRSLGAPGVVLLDGEIVGTWRQRVAGTRVLTIEIDEWTRLTRGQRSELAGDAEVIAATRDRSPDITWV